MVDRLNAERATEAAPLSVPPASRNRRFLWLLLLLTVAVCVRELTVESQFLRHFDTNSSNKSPQHPAAPTADQQLTITTHSLENTTAIDKLPTNHSEISTRPVETTTKTTATTAVPTQPATNATSSSTIQPHPVETTTKPIKIQPHPAINGRNPAYNRHEDGDISEFKCVAWRQTGHCSPDGPREPASDASCSKRIPSGHSGYCEIEHKSTGATRMVLSLHCSSLRSEVSITCDSFVNVVGYGANALEYTHDATFSYEANQQALVTANSLTNAPTEFKRAIVMAIYESLLPSVYASVKHLRSLGCSLPIELFYRHDETSVDHPILKALLRSDHRVYLREIKDSKATAFYTKLYAVYYSAFDQILLLDADNFAVRDPTYLFESAEFQATGAVFWPDFWHPGHSLFNVHAHSLLWQLFDLPFVDMFEQESGQVLIDRRVHLKAMSVLMYYGFSLPRLHQDLQLVWGDKDLFRLAWMKTSSEFHMIARPPGSAGMMNTGTNQFCGITMVQHDPQGQVLFLHRNMEKLHAGNIHSAWTHIQQFKIHASVAQYDIKWSRVVASLGNCWGEFEHWDALFTVTPMSAFPFRAVEAELLQLATEALAIAKT